MWGLVAAKTRWVFVTLHPPNAKVTTGHFSCHPFCMISLSLTLILEVGSQVYARSFLRFHVGWPQLFLLSPSPQKQSERVLTVAKVHRYPQSGKCFGCFLVSQGHLSTLILGLWAALESLLLTTVWCCFTQRKGVIGRKHPQDILTSWIWEIRRRE